MDAILVGLDPLAVIIQDTSQRNGNCFAFAKSFTENTTNGDGTWLLERQSANAPNSFPNTPAIQPE